MRNDSEVKRFLMKNSRKDLRAREKDRIGVIDGNVHCTMSSRRDGNVRRISSRTCLTAVPTRITQLFRSREFPKLTSIRIPQRQRQRRQRKLRPQPSRGNLVQSMPITDQGSIRRLRPLLLASCPSAIPDGYRSCLSSATVGTTVFTKSSVSPVNLSRKLHHRQDSLREMPEPSTLPHRIFPLAPQ